MKRLFSIAFAVLFIFSNNYFAQIPTNTLVQIVKAEDERRWDATLENLLKNPNAKIRERAALAVGRIGDENALPLLAEILLTEKSIEVKKMLVFAIGEIESARASETILSWFNKENNLLDARLLEAAGKIAAANPKHEKTVWLGKEVVNSLEKESSKQEPNREIVLAGLTAILRTRAEGGEQTTAKFLTAKDARIRADALNTLARLRAKSVNAKSRELLKNDKDAVVRANAARMLGVGEDKESLDLLLNAATKDKDSRVRVSAIRALGSLKNASVAEKLIPEMLSLDFPRKSFHFSLVDKSEQLEIATTLGRLLPNTNNQKAIEFLTKFSELDEYKSPEIDIAFAQIAPSKFGDYQKNKKDELKRTPQALSATFQGISELAKAPDTEEIKAIKETAKNEVLKYIDAQIGINKSQDTALSDAISAYSALKGDSLTKILQDTLKHKDPIVRATSAGLIADQPSSKENIEALKFAFTQALLQDKKDNDAQLAILGALFKLDKKESVGTLLIALNATDYLVRKRAFQLLKMEGLEKDFPGLPTTLENFVKNKKNQVLPYSPAFGTKLGQVLNTNADYIRAVSRKNGTVKAVFTTSKGKFTIDLTPEDAPLTVDNFIKLANSNYFNGVSVHRVVPNFVMQDGDPRGDGNGGPGWSIRCEVNMLSYERGAVGMALSGKDTGGSQWFVTHAPQPHLDGGYTVFGNVNEIDMKVVDSIVRGDKILSVKIIGSSVKKVTKKSK